MSAPQGRKKPTTKILAGVLGGLLVIGAAVGGWLVIGRDKPEATPPARTPSVDTPGSSSDPETDAPAEEWSLCRNGVAAVGADEKVGKDLSDQGPDFFTWEDSTLCLQSRITDILFSPGQKIPETIAFTGNTGVIDVYFDEGAIVQDTEIVIAEPPGRASGVYTIHVPDTQNVRIVWTNYGTDGRLTIDSDLEGDNRVDVGTEFTGERSATPSPGQPVLTIRFADGMNRSFWVSVDTTS